MRTIELKAPQRNISKNTSILVTIAGPKCSKKALRAKRLRFHALLIRYKKKQCVRRDLITMRHLIFCQLIAWVTLGCVLAGSPAVPLRLKLFKAYTDQECLGENLSSFTDFSPELCAAACAASASCTAFTLLNSACTLVANGQTSPRVDVSCFLQEGGKCGQLSRPAI